MTSALFEATTDINYLLSTISKTLSISHVVIDIRYTILESPTKYKFYLSSDK